MDYFKDKEVVGFRLRPEDVVFLNENYCTIMPDGIKQSPKNFFMEAVSQAVSRVPRTVDNPETKTKLKELTAQIEALQTALKEAQLLANEYQALSERKTNELQLANDTISALKGKELEDFLQPTQVLIDFPEFLLPVLKKEAAAQTNRRKKDIQPPHVLFELWLRNLSGTQDYLIYHYSPSDLKRMQEAAAPKPEPESHE